MQYSDISPKVLRFTQIGKGPVLIMIGGGFKEWGTSLDTLSQYFTLIIPSFSPQIISRQKGYDMVGYLETIVNELELKRFSVLAHSLGVFTAVLFAHKHHEKIQSLVLSNVPDLSIGDKARFDTLFEALTKGKNKPFKQENSFWFTVIDDQLKSFHRKKEELNLNVRTLVLSGDNDFLSSEKVGRYWKTYLKYRFNFKVFRHSGHFPMKDNPLYFSLVVKDFVLSYSIN